MTSKSSSSSNRHPPACSGRTVSEDRECTLCREKDRQMLTFITLHFGQLDKNWICKKHLLEAQRHCNNDGYLPKQI